MEVYVEAYNIEEIFFDAEAANEAIGSNETNTFLAWLQLSKSDDFNKHHKIKHQQNLISKFIVTAPKVQPVKAALNNMDAELDQKPAKQRPNELIVSETLAKIYYEQKKYHLAIETYKKLRLVYPEKSSYFAALIKEVERDLREGNK